MQNFIYWLQELAWTHKQHGFDTGNYTGPSVEGSSTCSLTTIHQLQKLLKLLVKKGYRVRARTGTGLKIGLGQAGLGQG